MGLMTYTHPAKQSMCQKHMSLIFKDYFSGTLVPPGASVKVVDILTFQGRCLDSPPRHASKHF